MIESAERELQAAGLEISVVMKEEEPKRLLLSEAEGWGADCIFVGARRLGRLGRCLTGSVSSAVAARAHYSVEIVRWDARSGPERAYRITSDRSR